MTRYIATFLAGYFVASIGFGLIVGMVLLALLAWMFAHKDDVDFTTNFLNGVYGAPPRPKRPAGVRKSVSAKKG